MRYLKTLALVFGLCTSGCMGQDAVVGNQNINGAVDQADGGNSEASVDDAGDGGAPSNDGSDATLDVATDTVNPPPDRPMVADGADVLGTDAQDAPDVTPVVDAPDAPSPVDVSDAGSDAQDAPDVSDVPIVMPRCGDMMCTPASGETCSSCTSDCGSCPPVDSGTDSGPVDTGADVSADHGTDSGPADTGADVPADMGSPPVCGDGTCNGVETCSSCMADCGRCDSGAPDTGPADTGVDVPTGCPTGLTYCGEFCRDFGTDTQNCGGCGNRCPNPTNGFATCDGTCGFACNTGYVRCGSGCVPTYPVLTHAFTGAIGAAMRHVDIRIAVDATPVTAYMLDACVGGLVAVSGGYHCQLDLARLLACRPWMNATYGPHFIFRDGAGAEIATSRTPGNPGATCYATLGSVPCITTTCNGRLYSDPVYLNMDGSTVYYNSAVTPACR